MEMGGLRERPRRFPHKSSSLQGPRGEVRRETVQVPLLAKTPGTRVIGQIHSSPQICARISIPIKSKPLFQMHKALGAAMGALGWTEGCVELEEELASPCVDRPLEGDGESRAGNVGLHREPRKCQTPAVH